MTRAVYLMVFLGSLIHGQVTQSKHNLSSGGTGSIKATDTDLVCIFCHTSHSGDSSAPLWNRESGLLAYTTYSSSTLFSSPGQPSGTSKLCLSCHDGTVALGNVLSRTDTFNMLNTVGGRIPSSLHSNLNTNLDDDHPVSFDPATAIANSNELNNPSLPVHFDEGGDMQCTTCHDPHDNTISPFLVQGMAYAELCKNCHDRINYNGQSTHDIRGAVWSGSGTNPWPFSPYNSVSLNSCINCHRTHGANHPERLLSHQNDEDVCLVCHNGNLGRNIANDLTRYSSHGVGQYSGHEPGEDMLTAPRHVECVDCHNPHQLNASAASAPWVNGTLIGVSGRTTSGVPVDPASREYEVCLKCHGLNTYNIPSPVIRQFDTTNPGDAFNPSNSSYHPVAAIGKSSRVPSLINGYSTSSLIYCTDCHNSSNSTNAGGNGPNGPHGSNEPYLLERRYDIGDNFSYSAIKYEMCFKCHDAARIQNEQRSGFEDHKKHISEEQTPCSVCHDPHGVADTVALINFDTSVVFPNQNGRLEFVIVGDRGYCYLDCHGENHDPLEYQRN